MDSNDILVTNCTSSRNSYGIALRRSPNNNISNNIVTESVVGIVLVQVPCSNNIISNNTIIANSQHGVRLDTGANNNEVCYNCFRDNGIDIDDDGVGNSIHDNYECPADLNPNTPFIPGYDLLLVIGFTSGSVMILLIMMLKKVRK